MNMSKLCNRAVTVVEAHAAVRDVAKLMRERHVGCVVIVRGGSGERVPVGVVTDRDIVLEVVARDLDPAATPVAVIMSTNMFCAREDQDACEVLQQMRAHGLRRVPVVGVDGVLLGILTFDDLVQWTGEHLFELIRLVDRELSQERSSPAR